MNTSVKSLLLLIVSASLGIADELESISKSFIKSATIGDKDALEKIYLDVPTRAKAIEAITQALPQLKSGEFRITGVPNELVIGDLGVTLICFESDKSTKRDYDPMICVRTSDGWRVYPWASQADLKRFVDQRTPEEQIHLKLFTEWAKLTEELLTKSAE